MFPRTSAVRRGGAVPHYAVADLPRDRYLESREDYRADLALAVLISHAEVKRRAVGCGRASGEMAEDGELPRSHNVGDRRHGRLSSSFSMGACLPSKLDTPLTAYIAHAVWKRSLQRMRNTCTQGSNQYA